MKRYNYKNIIKYYLSKSLNSFNLFRYQTEFGKVYLDEKNNGISRVIAAYGTREDDKQSLLKECLSAGSTVYIDLGSNIGVYPVLADSILSEDSFLISIEPDVRNIKTLKKNLRICNSNKIFLPYAITDTDGSARFKLSEQTNLNHLLDAENKEDLANKVAEVKCISLQTLINDYIPTYYKGGRHKLVIRMDIEGGEYKVLKSFNEYLEQNENKDHFKEIYIVYECHPPSINNSEDYENTLSSLINKGLNIKSIISAGKIKLSTLKQLNLINNSYQEVYSDNFIRYKINNPDINAAKKALISTNKILRYCVLNISSI